MTADTSTNVLTRPHRAFNERDAATARGLLADDVVWHVPGNHPIAGTYRGREEVWERYIAPMWSTPAQIDDHAALSHPEHRLVAVLHEVLNDLGDGEVRLPGIEAARVEDGRVAERWEFEEDQAEVDRFITRNSSPCRAMSRRPQREARGRG